MSSAPTEPEDPGPDRAPHDRGGDGGAGGGDGSDRSMRGLLKHSFIYSLVPVFSRVAGFLMLPFYWSELTPAEWGLAGMGELYLTAFAQILGVNLLVSAMSRFFFDHTGERDRNAVISSCTLALVAVSWLVMGTLFAFRAQLAPLLLASAQEGFTAADLSGFLGIVLLIIPFKLSTIASLTYLQILKRSRAYSLIQFAKILVELGLKVWALAVMDWGVMGFMLSILVGEALTTVALTPWVLKQVRPRIDLAVLRPILWYTLPLIPVGLCQVGLHQLDRRFLEHLSPNKLNAVGIYTAGYTFGMIVNTLLLGPFMQIWQPWIYSVQDAAQRAALVARVSTYAVLAIGCASLGTILFGREVVFLVDPKGEYAEAYRVIPLVATGYVFWALYTTTQIPMYIAKRTWPLLAINIVALLLNVYLNWTLVPRFDFMGSALATALTFASLAGLGMLVSRRSAHVPFELGRIAGVLATVLGGVLAARLLNDALPAATLAEALVAISAKAGVAVLLLAFVFFGVLHADERRQFLDWVRAKLPSRG